MPFSDDEQILLEENSKLKVAIIVVSFLLFGISFFNIAFCTTNACRLSFEVFLLGWFGMLMDITAISWLANLFLFIAWVLLTKNKNYAWIFGLLATVLSLSLLCTDSVIDNEGGTCNSITKIGLGYWLWTASCLTAFIGGLLFRKSKYK